jgi:hypothetical protein
MSLKQLTDDPILNICLLTDNYPDLLNFVRTNKEIYNACKGLLKYKKQIYSYEQDIDEPLDRNIKNFLEKTARSPQNVYYLNLMKEFLLQRYYKKIYSQNEIKQFLKEMRKILAYILNVYDLDPEEYLRKVDNSLINKYFEILEIAFGDSLYVDINNQVYIFNDLNYSLKDYEELLILSRDLVYIFLKKRPNSTITISNDKYYVDNVEIPKSKKWLKTLKEAQNKGLFGNINNIYQSLGASIDGYILEDFDYFTYHEEI